MPRKFRCYVPKGASRKQAKVPKEVSRKQAKVPQTDEPQYKDSVVQTEGTLVNFQEVGVQSEFVEVDDASVQTEGLVPSIAVCEVEVQTDKLNMEETSSQTDDILDGIAPPELEVEMTQLCEGNNDEKFLPLVKKHKGIFMNAKGSNIQCDVIVRICICLLHIILCQYYTNNIYSC